MAKRVRVTKKVLLDATPLPEVKSSILQIHKHIENKNPIVEWNVIREWLKSKYQSLAELKDLLRQEADMSVRAKNLYIQARKERKLFEIQYHDRMQIWRKISLQYWEKKKDKGLHKQITERMIEDRIIEKYNDLYVELQTRRETIKNTEESLKTLSDQVTNRGHDLRKLLDTEMRKPSMPSWIDDSSERK